MSEERQHCRGLIGRGCGGGERVTRKEGGREQMKSFAMRSRRSTMTCLLPVESVLDIEISWLEIVCSSFLSRCSIVLSPSLSCT